LHAPNRQTASRTIQWAHPREEAGVYSKETSKTKLRNRKDMLLTTTDAFWIFGFREHRPLALEDFS
jgi:hypothetical protein